MEEKEKAKLWLYHQLLATPMERLTENEIDLMEHLAVDEEVQSYLEEKLKKEH